MLLKSVTCYTYIEYNRLLYYNDLTVTVIIVWPDFLTACGSAKSANPTVKDLLKTCMEKLAMKVTDSYFCG